MRKPPSGRKEHSGEAGASAGPRSEPPPAARRDARVEAFFRDIPAEGSLGLLALGAVGVIAWRKVRDAERSAEKAFRG